MGSDLDLLSLELCSETGVFLGPTTIESEDYKFNPMFELSSSKGIDCCED